MRKDPFNWDEGNTPAPGGGHTIADEGTPLAAEPTLDFTGTGVTVTDVPGSTKTLVSVKIPFVGASAPPSPDDGDLWWDTDEDTPPDGFLWWDPDDATPLEVVTTVGTPGLDRYIPTEQAVREAIAAIGGGDVYGDAGAVDEHLAVFDVDGYHIKDGGVVPAAGIPDPATPEQGDVLYWDGANWVRLAHGASTDYLKSGGHGANPGWDTPAGTGDVLGDADAVDGNVVLFDGDGYHLKDGGAPGGGSTDVLQVQVFS